MIGPNSGGDNQTNFDPTNLQDNANTPSNTSFSMHGSVKQKNNNGILIKAIAALIIIVIVAYLVGS